MRNELLAMCLGLALVTSCMDGDDVVATSDDALAASPVALR